MNVVFIDNDMHCLMAIEVNMVAVWQGVIVSTRKNKKCSDVYVTGDVLYLRDTIGHDIFVIPREEMCVADFVLELSKNNFIDFSALNVTVLYNPDENDIQLIREIQIEKGIAPNSMLSTYNKPLP